jgi:alpha-L-fucosidase 2
MKNSGCTNKETGWSYAEAQTLIGKMLGRRLNYGTNLPAGDLLLAQSGTGGASSDYRRELDLDQAVARVSFTAHGVGYCREVLASHPDGVIAVRLTADRPGAIGFTLRYGGGRFPCSVSTQGTDTLVAVSHAFEKKHSDGQCGVSFQAWIRVLPEGGVLTAEKSDLRLSGAHAATVLIALNTDFQKRDPAALCARQIAAAQQKEWSRLRADHAAGIAEMLVQSHDGEIELLPALPKEWPTGNVGGLCARGGFTVDLAWKDGKVTAYRVASAAPRDVKIRVNGEKKTIKAEKL